MSTTPYSHKERKRIIMNRAEVILANNPCGDTDDFILSTQEARDVGDAVGTRNHKKLRDILSVPIEQLENHYDILSINDLKGEWASELQRITGRDGDIIDLLDNELSEHQINNALVDQTSDSHIQMNPLQYVKFLETVVYATAPVGTQEFDPRFATSARLRKGRHKLHARCLTILEMFANHEPGVRTVRENILDGDANALSIYLSNLSRTRLAQKALANIISEFDEGNADTMRELVREELSEKTDFDELSRTHILNWEMLPKEITDSPNRNKYIRKLIEDRAKTPEKRRDIARAWDDKRIDVLFDTASYATRQKREAAIYISSTFDGGAGLYLAAVLDHPLDTEKCVVIADNPIEGNALYFVDEQLAEIDSRGSQYGWKDVLGTHRRIARERGARRRYHTGNWAQLPRAICEYGGNYQAASEKKKIVEEASKDRDLVESLEATDLLRAAIARSREVTNRLKDID